MFISLSDTVRRMAVAGASGEVIAMAVEAIEAAQAKLDESRAAARDRKRKQRGHGTVAGQSRDMDVTVTANTLSLPPSPQTPQPPTHTRECVTTRMRKADADPEGFQAFWDAYPTSLGRKMAVRAYVGAIGRGVTLGTLVAAVERDKATQWRERPPDKIPHASTWLNQDRWLDEPPPNVHPLRQPHERRHQPSKFEQHQDNLERAFAGAEVASRLRTIEPSGSF